MLPNAKTSIPVGDDPRQNTAIAPSRPKSAKIQLWNWVRRRLNQIGTKPTPVILGTRSALKIALAMPDIQKNNTSHPLIVPVIEHSPSDWAAKIAAIDSLMNSSRIDRLIVALPIPKDCDSEAVFGRVTAIGGSVTFIDTGAATMFGNGNIVPRSTDGAMLFTGRAQIFAKTAIDYVGAALLLALFSPLLIIIAALIRSTSPGPALFVQPRLGRYNSIIPVVKFRTMYIDRGDAFGGRRTVPGDPRVTPLGRILRRWSLDELPQLLNVLAGHMSLIGPRPHAVMMKAGELLYLEAVAGYLSRHNIKPGITGWAQVNKLSGQVDSVKAGRNRLIYDLYYIQNWSIWLDVKIFWKSAFLVFDRINRY